MQTGKSTVKDIFDGTRIFNIPTYQRGYSWEREDNLEDFLKDLISQQPDRSYFLGSFLLHLNGSRGEFDIVDVVDGQQRLTTLVIFLHVLIGKLISKSSSMASERTKRIFVKDGEVFKLESANEGSSFLHDNILCDGNFVGGQVKFLTRSQRLLLDAKVFFDEQLESFDIAQLERIYKTAVGADVLLYVVNSISKATQIFELLNDRGRRLTDLEAIKSFLMYNAGVVFENPDQAVGKIQEDFGEIYRIIEVGNVNDRDVLRYHTIAFEKCPADFYEKPKALIKDRILRLVGDPERYPEARDEIRGYSSRLKKSFQLYSKIREDRFSNPDLAKMFMIGRVAPFYPVLMRVFSDRNEDFSKLVSAINKFSFRSSLARLRSNGEKYQYTCLRNGEDVVDLIERFVSDNWWNVNGRAKEAVEYENYYEWIDRNTVRFILISYENSLRRQKGFPVLGAKEYFSKDDREKLSIEHITARRASDIKLTEDFNERYLHSIGNLVIDHAASNSSKGNKAGGEKIHSYKKAPLMSQNEIDGFGCDWGKLRSVKSFVSEREKIMKKFVVSMLGE